MALVTFKHPLTEVRHLTSLNGDDLNGNPKEGVRFGCHDGGPRSLISIARSVEVQIAVQRKRVSLRTHKEPSTCADSRASWNLGMNSNDLQGPNLYQPVIGLLVVDSPKGFKSDLTQ